MSDGSASTERVGFFKDCPILVRVPPVLFPPAHRCVFDTLARTNVTLCVRAAADRHLPPVCHVP